MKTSLISSRIFAATLAAAALAGGVASAQTLGERLDSGAMSQAAFEQLIAGAGLSDAEARELTASDIARIKRQDD